MTQIDRYGLPLSTSFAEAAEWYGVSVDAVLGFEGGIIEAVDRALEIDPGFALAHIHKARALQVEGRMSEALESKRAAQFLAGRATAEEQSHIAALSRTIDGDGPAAIASIKEHLGDYPRSALLLAQVVGPFGLFAFGGYQDRHEQNLALLESVQQAYGEDWWFVSSLAFGLNELNRFSESAPLAERAFELKATGNAAHTVAHVHFETGGLDSGIRFLEDFLPGHSRAAQIHSHLTWHLALFELAQGNTDAVSALMADGIRPAVSAGSPLGKLADGASLAWRQRLLGIDPGSGNAAEVANFAGATFSRPGVTFADLHCALAHAAAGNGAAVEALAAQLREREVAGKIPAGAVVPAVVEAIAAFAREDYNAAISLLEPVAHQVVKVGGSNAQREVFEDTLLEAYLRAGRAESASALIERRLARRPSPLDSARLARARSITVA